MIRLKLLVTVAVSLFVLSAALPSSLAHGGSLSPGLSPGVTGTPGEFKSEGSISPSSPAGTEVSMAMWPPKFFNFALYDTLYICPGETIYDTIVATSTVAGKIITITKISGPGDFSSVPSTSPAYGYYSYTPDSSGSFQVVYEAKDNGGLTTRATKTYVIFINGAPVITTGDSSLYSCYPGEIYTYEVKANDPDNDPLRFRLLTPFGSIDALTGVISFSADTTGKCYFGIEVSDTCGADTANICLTVAVNALPEINGFIKKYTLCALDTICFSIIANDPDPGDSLVITQLEGPGVFDMVDHVSGRTCFLPVDVDSADYIFVYGVTDNCLRGEHARAATPPFPLDTVIITVIVGPTLKLDCPGDTTLFICRPDTICIPMRNIPDSAVVTVSPPSAWYNSVAKTLCFFTDCSVEKHLKITASTICGTDSCQFTARVTLNSAPLVILPPDTSLYICQSQEICLPVGISDADRNIAGITVLPWGHYDPTTGKICFIPPSAGDHKIIVRAVDACGAVGIDSLNIHVAMNKPPVVESAPDFTVRQCAPVEICFPVKISDPNNPIKSVTVLPYGTYNPQIGNVCFMPGQSGIHSIVIAAVDSCGAVASDTTNVNVILNSAPVVKSIPDSTVFLCRPESICFPLTISDADGNISSITVDGGATYSNGYVCFDPIQSGFYHIIARVADSCGFVNVDTTVINVIINFPPIVSSAKDYSITQCTDDPICFDVSINDIDGNLQTVSSNRGVYDPITHRVCFTPNGPGRYQIIITASDSCYASGVDTTTVTVSSGPVPMITCPSDTIRIEDCAGVDSLCVDLAISGADTVMAENAVWNKGRLCFAVLQNPGIHNFSLKVIAANACGRDTCIVPVHLKLIDQPFIVVPDTVKATVCRGDTVCAALDISGLDSVTISDGELFPDGHLCIAAAESGLKTVIVTAYNSCGRSEFNVVFDIALKPTPVISCPPEPIAISICRPGPVCIDLPIANYTEVSADGATWSDGKLCFNASGAGQYILNVRADNECGTDRCQVTVNVTEVGLPQISCPEGPVDVTFCEPKTICIDVPISNYDSIAVDGGTWSNGQLCVEVATTGQLVYTIIAANRCGADTCQVQVNATRILAPEISCPIEPFDISLCRLDTVCIDLPISNARSVDAGNAIWKDGRLCFLPEAPGNQKIMVVASNECGTDSCIVEVNVTVDPSAQLSCPADTVVTLCGPETICRPVGVIPPNAAVTVSPIGAYSDGTVCFTPDTAGVYEILVRAQLPCGADSCRFKIRVLYDRPPIIIRKDTVIAACEPHRQFTYDVSASDPENDPITFGLISAPGSIDSVSGLITFTADTAGTFCFRVTASDYCRADTATVCVRVSLNAPPVVLTGPDTTLAECLAQEVCIPVSITDVDRNLMTVVSNLGSYSDGRVCFMPPSAGVYRIVVEAVDSCGTRDADTTIVTIQPAQPVELICPKDTSLLICEPDTICMSIGGIPEEASVTVTPASAWYDRANGTICFYTNCSVIKNLKVVVATNCAKDSCVFKANVTLNSRPLVLLPPDTTVFLCELGSVCVPAGISDVDNNIVSLVMTPGAYFNSITGKICFAPTGEGDYNLAIRAIDACGAYGTDSMKVRVVLNRPPVLVSPAEIRAPQCRLSEICFPITVSDPDNGLRMVTVSPSGRYDPKYKTICFTPSAAGNFRLIITATDNCGLRAVDTTMVRVTLNAPPVVISAPDTTVLLCGPGMVNYRVWISDPDSNLAQVTVSGGALYANGQVTFNAGAAGSYSFVTTATDSCGAVAADTTKITVTMNRPPMVALPRDSTITVCALGPICIPVTVTDPDNNIKTIQTNLGAYDNQTKKVCFTPTDAGIYQMIVSATDNCNLIVSDTMNITIRLGERADILCPSGPIDKSLCQPGQVCHDLVITPTNAVVTTSNGTYSNGKVCFRADISGKYDIRVIASSECGADTCNLSFNVAIGQTAQVTCPADTSIFLCSADSIFRPVTVSPASAVVTVLPTGVYRNGVVGFRADTTGNYLVTVIALTDCGADTCQFRVHVTINGAPTVKAGNDTTYFQCVFSQICRPVTISDPDNNIQSVTVTPNGTYNSEKKEICFTPTGIGNYCLIVTAQDNCGKTGVDTVCISVTSGPSAQIQCATSPYSRSRCTPGQVCVPLSVTPSTAQVTVSYGAYANGQICFQADTAGTYHIRAIASAICGADTCDITVNVSFDEAANIICPDLPTSVSLCRPDSVRIPLPITPATANVTILPRGRYNFSTHLLSFFADTAGTYRLTVIASAPCGADTCIVRAIVSMETPPQVTCPGDIDTTVCVAETSEICFPVNVVGSGAIVSVLPSGHYSGGMACIPITAAGTYPVTVIASTLCGADTCKLNITVRDNRPPALTVPADQEVPGCNDELEEICIDGIFATDPDGDPVTITKTCGLGSFTAIRADSGKLCFTPLRVDTTYQFCFEANDGCRTITKSMNVSVFQSPLCGVCIDIAIKTDSCVVVGSIVPVNLEITTNDPIGGFDLLISYDASVMQFFTASKGLSIDGWEYFTYRLGNEGDCGSGCPSGLLRLVGIADVNNGQFHPPQDQLAPQGVLVRLNFKVANDQNLGGQFLPLNFYWVDCGDNAFSDPSGNSLYLDSRIYNSSGDILWDEFNEALYPENHRINGLGAPDSCLKGGKTIPIRCIYFHNGGICVTHPDSIDARGDLNLNNVAYEIGDAVVFTNYFLYGLRAFTVSVNGQTAASDVNADGMVLTVADLVYLIRVITGDASPIPKLSPEAAAVDLFTRNDGSKLNISMHNGNPVGAGLMIFKYSGLTPSAVELGPAAGKMDLKYVINDSEIRVLLYSYDIGDKIDPGDGELLNISFSGTGDIKLVETSFAGYYGETLVTRMMGNLVPKAFVLSQNYPNPFNPTTSIDMTMPVACQWQMTIFNVNGRVVKQMSGNATPGTTTITWDGRNDDGQPVTSGVYFYKIKAGDFCATKKMTLLK